MIEAYKSFWVKSFAFGGITRRSDFWLAYAGNVIVILFLLSLGFLSSALFGDSGTNTLFALVLIYVVASIVPNCSIQVRRLRDAGFNPWLILISLVPYVGGIVLFIMYLLPSKAGSPE